MYSHRNVVSLCAHGQFTFTSHSDDDDNGNEKNKEVLN